MFGRRTRACEHARERVVCYVPVDVPMRAPSRAARKLPDAEILPAVPLTAWAPTGTG